MAKNYKKNDETTKDKILSFAHVDDTMEGFEDINNMTMAIPFIKILQKLSPELNKAKTTFVKDAKVGDFFNTVTKEVYGNGINAVVIKFERIYTEWLSKRGGLVGYHSPEDAEKIAVNPEKFGGWKTDSGNDLQIGRASCRERV